MRLRKVLTTLGMSISLLFAATRADATTCPNATAIASLPVFNQAVVCGTSNDITSSNVTSTCGSTLYYGGNEALYTFTPTTSGAVEITLNGGTSTDYTGIFVFDGCPTTTGTNCVNNVTSSAYVKSLTVTVTAGTTYYLMFDTWPTPNSPCPATFSIATCAAPTALASSAITTTGATVTWTSSAANFQVEYGTSSTLGSATNTRTSVAATNPRTLTGLTPSTNYKWWVRSICAPGDTSAWSAMSSFTTNCLATAAPYSEGFNSGALPTCWTNSNSVNSTNANMLWKFGSGYGYGTTNNGRTSGTFAFVDASSPSSDVVILTSPIINLSSLTTPFVKFDWFKNNSSSTTSTVPPGYPNNNLKLEGYNGSSWVTLFDDTSNATTWRTVRITLPAAFSNVTNAQFRFSVDKSLSGNFYDDVLLDSFSVTNAPSCLPPGTAAATAVTSSSATINWTAATPAPSSGYQYEVRSSGAAGSGATGLAASGSTGASVITASVTGLAPATTYTVYVRSNCGTSGYSVWVPVGTFSTACVAITTLPWNDGIESVTTIGANNFPACWQKLNGTWSSADAAFTSYHDPRNGTRYLTTSYNAVNDVIMTPGFQLTAGTSYDFSFYWAGDDYDGWEGSVLINTAQNTSGAGMLGNYFVNMTDVTPLGTYTKVTRTYVPTTSGVYYFGVQVNSNGNPWYLGFDDFRVNVTPTCAEPTAITTSAVTSNGVTLSWTAPTPAPGQGYRYEVRSSGAAGSGTTGLAATGTTGAGVITATVTGLTPQTTYNVYVRSRCSATDSSTWASGTNFTTACVPVSTLPWNDGIESVTTTGANNFPACWQKLNGTWSSADAAFTSYHDPRNGTRYLTTSYNAVNDAIVTPGFQLTAGTSYDFSFYWAGDNYSGWEGSVGVNTTQNLTGATMLGSYFVNMTDVTPLGTYTKVTRTFVPTTSGVYYFGIMVNSNGNPWYLGFDDFSLRVTPTCAEPTAITTSAVTSNGVTLSWTAPTPAPGQGYRYEIRSSGAAGSGTTGLAATGTTGAGVITATVTGLTPQTTYNVYVRSRCSATDSSTWASGTNFTTACAAISAPYSESFNSGSLPTCWTNSNSVNSTNANMLWRFSGAPGYGATNNGRTSGTYAWVDASSPSSDVVMLTSPFINLSSLTTPFVKFDWFKNNRSSTTSTAPSGYPNNNLKLEGYNGSSWVTLFDDTSNATTWRTVGITLPAAFNGVANAQFRFSVDKSLSAYFYDDVLLDSFSVTNAPPCVAPTGVIATATSSTGATLNWTATSPAPANGYQYEVRSSGAAGSGATGLAASGSTGSAVTTASVTGLAAATTYSVYVRAVCSGTSNSPWTTATTLTTPCVPVTVNLGADTAICAGNAVTFSAGNAGASYLWSNGATTQSITVSTAGSYSVRVTNASGCIGRDTVNVTTNALPVVNLGADTVICAGSSLSLNAGNAGASYLWSNGATTQSITVSTAGSYSVRVTNASGCIGRDTVNVTFNALPVVSLGNDTAICAGNTVTFSAGNTGASYLWSNGATTQSITVSAAGSYSVRVTNASGCIGRDTVNVTVNALPVVSLGADTAICAGSSLTLSAGNAGASYLWSNGATTQSITVSAAGSYSVRVTNASGCVGRDTVNVTTNALPVVNLGRDTVICAGGSATLDAGNAGASYLWSNGATTQSITVNATGSYSVAVTNATGCIGRDTINVMFNTLPVAGTITVSGQAPTFTFSVAGSSGAAIRGWRFGDGSVDTALNPTKTYAANGTYTVTYYVANGCGADSASTTVTVNSYGVNNVSVEGQIRLFPNPSHEYVMVENTAAAPMKTLRILSVSGALIREVTAHGGAEQRIEVSHLAAGTYLVRIELADGSIAIKRMQVKH